MRHNPTWRHGSSTGFGFSVQLALIPICALGLGCSGTAWTGWPGTSGQAPAATGTTLTLTPTSPPAATTTPESRNRIELAPSNPSDERVFQARIDVSVTVLYVQVPSHARAALEPLWNHLREDVLDAATEQRIRQNGLRIGFGHDEWWPAVKATLDAVPGTRVLTMDPLILPPHHPLALELDQRPREQTLFVMGTDGVLTGETWPQSRNVLRVVHELDLTRPERVRLHITPEVRQRLEGFRWVRGEGGFSQVPQYNGRSFWEAAFSVNLGPGEFLLLAPAEMADVYGILGGALLTREEDGVRHDSYVFLRADVNHVSYRN
ncbi:MAG: hypothetical protein IPM18_06655 [Phycisphaerales bacterium]|nr:hypothetical protein [Phycisphaerales bacterium]